MTFNAASAAVLSFTLCFVAACGPPEPEYGLGTDGPMLIDAHARDATQYDAYVVHYDAHTGPGPITDGGPICAPGPHSPLSPCYDALPDCRPNEHQPWCDKPAMDASTDASDEEQEHCRWHKHHKGWKVWRHLCEDKRCKCCHEARKDDDDE